MSLESFLSFCPASAWDIEPPTLLLCGLEDVYQCPLISQAVGVDPAVKACLLCVLSHAGAHGFWEYTPAAVTVLQSPLSFSPQ